jgi:hypothetical protein
VGGSHKHALRALGMDAAEYLKFMDFLRHPRLKPEKIELTSYRLRARSRLS